MPKTKCTDKKCKRKGIIKSFDGLHRCTIHDTVLRMETYSSLMRDLIPERMAKAVISGKRDEAEVRRIFNV